MDLSEYAESLRRELTSITRFAGEDIARAAEMISETLDSSIRLALLDVLTAAAEEITAGLNDTTIDVRLTGTQPEFVVTVARATGDTGPEFGDAGEDAGNARVTLRLSENLKARVEAAAMTAGMSVNSWLVRAIGRALEPQPGGPRPRSSSPPGRRGLGKRYTGFARS
jgi:hypothetical protein